MDFTDLYFTIGNVATQLRCGCMLSEHFITNFPQNVPVKFFWEKIGQYLATIWTIVCGLLFWPPCISTKIYIKGTKVERTTAVHSAVWNSFILFHRTQCYIKTTWKINVLKVFHKTERPVALTTVRTDAHTKAQKSKKTR